MKLKPFEVKLTRTAGCREEYKILTIWVATLTAAREAAGLFASEEGWSGCEFTIKPLDP